MWWEYAAFGLVCLMCIALLLAFIGMLQYPESDPPPDYDDEIEE